MANPRPPKKKRLRSLRRAETGYTVDPLSDLVSATELRLWRSDPTTQKVMRYLNRWRGQLLEALGEGGSIEPQAEATAMRTTEFVSKNQLLNDILNLSATDIAEFYGQAEPQEKEAAKK